MKWIFLFLFFPMLANAQESFPNVTKLKVVDKKLRYRGKLYEALQWKDKLGENVLITSVLGPYKGKSMDMSETQTIELFAVHYVKTDTGYKALWRLNDIQKDCELDIAGFFIPKATTVTDLDKDGIAETKVQYGLSCRGDVSPSYVKLIIHEEADKYALRGQRWVWIGEEADTTFKVTDKNANLEKFPVKNDDYTWEMGRYENEKEFAKAPEAFLLFARREWIKFAVEKPE